VQIKLLSVLVEARHQAKVLKLEKDIKVKKPERVVMSEQVSKVTIFRYI
jgi:hypothetical protein